MAPNNFQYRNNTNFNVEFPEIPSFNLTPRGFKLYQEKGTHDYAEITYTSFTDTFYGVLKTGVLVRITWSNEIDKGEWVGYVYGVQNTTQSTLVRPVVVTALGAGFFLKESGNKIWLNKTASEIVTDIAKKFKLTPKVTSSKVRFAQQTLVGHTYWEKVKELAERIGYVTQIIGTELHFHPMDKMIDQFNGLVPVLSFQDSEADSSMSYEGQTLDKFKPLVGDYIEFGQPNKKEKTISGINPITGKMFTKKASPSKVGKNLRKSVSDPIFNQFIPNRVAEDEAGALEVAKAMAQLARWSIPAEGSAQGQARISPYKTVQISGTTDFTDSLWVITSTMHRVDFDGRYQVDFTCVTDGTGALKTSAFRTENSTMVGVRNEEFELSTGVSSVPTTSVVSSPSLAFKETETGFAANPSAWIGR